MGKVEAIPTTYRVLVWEPRPHNEHLSVYGNLHIQTRGNHTDDRANIRNGADPSYQIMEETTTHRSG